MSTKTPLPFIFFLILLTTKASASTDLTQDSIEVTYYRDALENPTDIRYLKIELIEYLEFEIDLSAFVNLEYLDLSEIIDLDSIPKGLESLQSLRSLDLHRCSGLKYFPSEILELPDLRYLDISKTAISSIPYEINKLSGLCVLLVHSTSVNSLPESISELDSLKYLSILNTDITHVPKEILTMQSLEIVITSNKSIISGFTLQNPQVVISLNPYYKAHLYREKPRVK
jgi:Leucine-rich repeat (LRR) protein